MMSPIWVVLPVKPFAVGKSRIALPLLDRIELNTTLFDHVLATAIALVGPARCVVVSRCEDVLAAARRNGARALQESGTGLNDALEQGARFAAERGAAAVLSLFTDLPWLTVSDLHALVRGTDQGEVAIAPDDSGRGTNAMLMPPGAIPYRHGRDSCWHHLAAAREAGLSVRIVRNAGLAGDLDSAETLATFRAFGHRKPHSLREVQS